MPSCRTASTHAGSLFFLFSTDAGRGAGVPCHLAGPPAPMLADFLSLFRRCRQGCRRTMPSCRIASTHAGSLFFFFSTDAGRVDIAELNNQMQYLG